MLDRVAAFPSRAPDANPSGDACCIVADLFLDGKDVALEGLVLRLSAERALFREASRYLLDRRGSRAKLRFDGEEYPVRIERTTKAGYALKLEEAISAEKREDLLSRFATEA